MENGNYDIYEMLKYTLKGKWFKSADEMTNFGEYNFKYNIMRFKLESIKWENGCERGFVRQAHIDVVD